MVAITWACWEKKAPIDLLKAGWAENFNLQSTVKQGMLKSAMPTPKETKYIATLLILLHIKEILTLKIQRWEKQNAS